MEIWKDIIGYEGIYQVSNLSRVKSVERLVDGRIVGFKTKIKEKILKHNYSGGYYKVALFKDGLGNRIGVHRLVALAFIPNPENKPQVNHINSDKSDNSIGNLEWVTIRENITHFRKTQKLTSNYSGVCFDKSKNKYLSYINLNGKRISLGNYVNEIDAANAYQQKLQTIS
jgi:hypothetical protein